MQRLISRSLRRTAASTAGRVVGRARVATAGAGGTTLTRAAAAASANPSMAKRLQSTVSQQPVFSSMRIFKTKCALDIKPLPAKLSLSANQRYYALEQRGSIALQFAEAIEDAGAGAGGAANPATNTSGQFRRYNWTRGDGTHLFMLSPFEIGDILAWTKQPNHFAPAAATAATAGNGKPNELVFTHDPNAQTAEAGQQRKELRVTRLSFGDRKPGYFFNFHSFNAQTKASKKYSIALTEGEFFTFLTAAKSILPQLYAWGHAAEPIFGVSKGGAAAGGATASSAEPVVE